MEEESGYCDDCERRVLVRRRGINHLVHLLLTILTAGIWLLVWGYQDYHRALWRCTQCGSTAVHVAARGTRRAQR